MSVLLDKFNATDQFVSEDNFCIIRNDLRYILKPLAIEEVSSEELEDYSKEDFIRHTESIRSAIAEGEEISDTFDNLEEYANYSAIIMGRSANILGLLFNCLSFLSKEGSSLQANLFEKLRFGHQDNPDKEELYYRDIWNHTVAKSSVSQRMVIWSLILEISPQIYGLSIDGTIKYNETGSKVEAFNHIRKSYSRS